MHTITAILLICFFTVFTSGVYPHNEDNMIQEVKSNGNKENSYDENVHMYICLQALSLLKDKYPNFDYTKFDQRIGSMSDQGTRAWQTGKITTGSYREDKEDVVFDIRGPFSWYVSNSHFWNADDRTNGDNTLTYLNSIGHFPNAFTKLNRYKDGQWYNWSNGYGGREYINYLHQSGYVFRYSYHTRGLINFFRTRKIWLESFVNTAGQETLVREEITATDNVFNAIIWETLGRMSHLIQDLSVPAHVHNDVHVRGLDGGDCYHNFIDDGAYLNYNMHTAKTAGGVIDPYSDPADPIRFLAYTSAQLADHYPSGPDCLEIPQQHPGNNFLPGGTNPMIENYYQQLGSPPQNITDLNTMGSYCFNHAIRSVAGLFYWFGVETGMFPPDPKMLPNITGFISSNTDNKLYRGEAIFIQCEAAGNVQNYEFRLFVCDTARECFLPVPGLSVNQSGNGITIKNLNFKNNWTCSRYDSACFNTSVNLSAEPPLYFTIRVKASNQYGHDIKFYGTDELHWIYPNQFLRPNPPPFSGCPILAVNDGSKFVYDNNLLHRSELTENKNKFIEDKYILRTKPAVSPDDNSILLAVKETNIDVNYFDQFRLVTADHPAGTQLGITENNDIVIFSSKDAVSPTHAELSGNEITNNIKYGLQNPKFIKGNYKDILTAKFPDNVKTPLGSDSVALIMNPGSFGLTPVLPVVKDIAGTITIQDSKGNNEITDLNFSKRIVNSEVIVPVYSKKGISSMSLEWKGEFQFSYLAYAGINYTGFLLRETELIDAEDFFSGNALNLLKEKDGNILQLDSSNQIILKFRNSMEPVPPGFERSYIFITHGRYEKGESIEQHQNGTVKNQTGQEKDINRSEILIGNYPNPFNPLTKFYFTLPEIHGASNSVKIVIYDMLGNEISTVLKEKKTPGDHSAVWNASDSPSGVYFYKITYGNFSKTGKMTLIK